MAKKGNVAASTFSEGRRHRAVTDHSKRPTQLVERVNRKIGTLIRHESRYEEELVSPCGVAMRGKAVHVDGRVHDRRLHAVSRLNKRGDGA